MKILKFSAKVFFMLAFQVSFLGMASAQFGRQKIALECKHISPIGMSYLQRHITFSKPSSNLEKRTIDQFTKKLDPTKIYLLKSDIAQIKKMMSGIFTKINTQDCSAIVKSHDLLKKRIADRVKYATKYLGPKFKFQKETAFIFDPDIRKPPVTQAEANQFLKKYIQFQVANYLATDMKLAEAKQNVIKSYERVLRRVNDFKEVDLWSLYLDAFAHGLDPHSSYLSADQLEDFEIQMRLSLEGIGATLSSKDGFTTIEQLIPGGAAERSGKLKPKDKIVAVAQGEKGKSENVIEMDLRDVVRKIRGQKGTKVKLSILRKEGKGNKRFDVVLARDKIKLEDEAASIHYFEREVKGVKKKIGLLNLPSFYADNRRKGRSATKDMAKLLKEAKAKHVDGIVLDLSTNGGGSLDDAVKIAGLFFAKGNVVKQSSRDPSTGEIALADTDPNVQWPGPLVVLTSRISASASEIVSGTLKDYKRAIIVGGDHTFGKGSVQSVEPLPPGLGALKTTVGMFFTAGGNSTQHRGVDADIVFPSAFSTEDIGEKTLDYSLPPKTIKRFTSAEAKTVDDSKSWSEVDLAMVGKLNKKSQERIKKDKDFQKLIKDIVKAKKRGKLIRVSEVMDKEKAGEKGLDKSEEEDDEDHVLSREEKMEKYLKRPDIKEAVNIMADFLAVRAPETLTVDHKTKLKSGKKKN